MDQENAPQDVPQTVNYEPPAPVLPTSGLALASLVSGILGFTMLPVVGGIIAIITGYLSRKETRSTPPAASGDGLATAGIVMGWVQIGLMVIGLCCLAAYLVLVLGIFRSSYHSG